MVRIELYDLLAKTQEYIAKYYATALTDEQKHDQLKAYIEKYILDGGFLVHGFTEEELINRLYAEMVEYSILTPFLGSPDIDEININAWDDIALTYSDGRMEKLEEHFCSPQHAVDIVKRLLHHSGMIIDNATPIAQGHLPGNTRITAIKSPVVDEEAGISVSIRLLHPQRVDRKHIIEGGMATEEMIAFLEMCIRYGVSVVIAGRTSSGKTTLMNALLSSIPDDKRIYTIESGARELFLVKKNRFGEEMSTSGSSTCYIYAPDFYAENITFANTAGRVGQAVACFVSADRAYFKGCRFLGNQDTLYTYGKGCRQYYEDCYVEGTVDFIFGWSTAVFNRCTIHSLGKGYLTAPSTDKEQKYGYVFYDCKMTAEPGVEGVALSRPWRPYAKAVFVRCDLGGHIAPAGWDNWGKKSNEETVTYAEYQSTGAGARPSERASFGHQLKDLTGYSIEEVLGGTDGWNPVKNGNALVSVKR